MKLDGVCCPAFHVRSTEPRVIYSNVGGFRYDAGNMITMTRSIDLFNPGSSFQGPADAYGAAEAGLVQYRADNRRATSGELSMLSKTSRGSTVVSRAYTWCH